MIKTILLWIWRGLVWLWNKNHGEFYPPAEREIYRYYDGEKYRYVIVTGN